jgi:hypothetical protein
VLDSQNAGSSRAVDSSAAARLYGSASETTDGDPGSAAAGTVNDDPDTEPSGEWLDAAALGPEDVDEDALATAMAEDELGAVTPEEMASLEAGLVLEDDPTEIDGEEPDR